MGLKDLLRGVDLSKDQRIDWDENKNPIYIGIADKGSLTSADVWIMTKITWDEDNNPILIEAAKGIWDSRSEAF